MTKQTLCKEKHMKGVGAFVGTYCAYFHGLIEFRTSRDNESDKRLSQLCGILGYAEGYAAKTGLPGVAHKVNRLEDYHEELHVEWSEEPTDEESYCFREAWGFFRAGCGTLVKHHWK